MKAMVYNSVSTDKQTKTTATAPRLITFFDVLRAIGQLLTIAAIYAAQRTAAVLKAARHATIAARIWLRVSHEFYGLDGDPIQCTGWQFIGYNLIAAIVALLLCIKL